VKSLGWLVMVSTKLCWIDQETRNEENDHDVKNAGGKDLGFRKGSFRRGKQHLLPPSPNSPQKTHLKGS